MRMGRLDPRAARPVASVERARPAPWDGPDLPPDLHRGPMTLSALEGGTLIKTLHGERPAAELELGDRVLTRDNGFQPVRWIARDAHGTAEQILHPALRPVEIAPGALGRGMPERPLFVSPALRLLLTGHGVEMRFGREEVLVPAGFLDRLPGVRAAAPRAVHYVRLLFDRHELLMADGLWCESLHLPGGLPGGHAVPAARRTLNHAETAILLS
ncbi:MAG: Hint domain-containing protein [Pseudomonadota bacterium]